MSWLGDGKVRQQSLRVEILEDRTVPAGNVSATLVGNTLRIVGDAQSNSVFVYQQGGNVVVEGSSSTTVNGLSSVSFLAANVAGLDIRMNDGNDSVTLGKTPNNTVTGLTLSRLLQYNGGNGDDTLEVANVSVARTTTIRGGDGDDSVTINNGSHFSSSVSISLDTGSTSESVSIDNATFDKPTAIRGSDVDSTVNITANTGSTTFNASLTIRTQSGNDQVTLDGVDVSSGPLTIGTGDGVDQVTLDDGTYKILSLNTGLGDDWVNIGTTTAVSVTLGAAIVLGDGTNHLNIGNGMTSTDFGLLSILGGSGVDIIALDKISVLLGPTNIRTLAGNDILTIQNSSFSSSNVTADMGAGDDTVLLNSNTFETSNQDRFDGGSGNDSIVSSGNSGLNASEIVNFEFVAPTLP
jgi:hypothetical protein